MAKKKRKNDPDLLVPLPPPAPMSPERLAREAQLLETLERASGAEGDPESRRDAGAQLRRALRELGEAGPEPAAQGSPPAAYLRWSAERLQDLFQQECAEIRRLHRRADACLAASLAALLTAFGLQAPGPEVLAAFALQLVLFLGAAATAVAWWRTRAHRAPRLPAAVFTTDADHPERAPEASWLARTRRSLQSLAADAGGTREALAQAVRRCEAGALVTVGALLALPVWALARLLV